MTPTNKHVTKDEFSQRHAMKQLEQNEPLGGTVNVAFDDTFGVFIPLAWVTEVLEFFDRESSMIKSRVDEATKYIRTNKRSILNGTADRDVCDRTAGALAIWYAYQVLTGRATLEPKDKPTLGDLPQ